MTRTRPTCSLRLFRLLLLGLALGAPAATALADENITAEQGWKRGRSLIEQGLQDRALDPLRRAAALAPDHVDIQRDYMDLMQAQGFHREVVDEYFRRKQQHPTPLSYFLYGRATGDVDLAEQAFQAALKLDPDHLWSLQGLGGVAAIRGNYDEALTHFDKAAELAPDLAEIHNKVANIHLVQGNVDAATQAWNEAIRLAPDDYHAYLNLGAVRSMAGDLDGAADLLQRAVHRAPGNPLAHVNYAYILFKLQRFDDSLSHFAAALAINPRDRTVQGSRDLVTQVQGGRIPFAAFAPYERALAAQMTEPRRAVQHYNEVLLLAPSFVTAHINLGLALVSLQRHDEALESLARAAELAPDSAAARYNLGYLLLGMGRLDEVKGHLEASHRLEPDDVDTLVALAMLALAQGRADAARRRYGDALQLQPRSPTLWAQMAAAQAEAGLLAEAVESARQALDIAPGFVPARIQLVAILRADRRYDEAITELQQLERLAPDHPDLAAERASLESARSVQAREARQPGKLGVSRILVSSRKVADRLHVQLSRGASFKELARTHSEGPEKLRGGAIGFVDPEEMRPEVRDALARLDIGDHSPVIDLGERFLLLRRTR